MDYSIIIRFSFFFSESNNFLLFTLCILLQIYFTFANTVPYKMGDDAMNNLINNITYTIKNPCGVGAVDIPTSEPNASKSANVIKENLKLHIGPHAAEFYKGGKTLMNDYVSI